MIHLLLSIFGILVTILFVVGTHEAAHFYAARLLGVKVLRFSIGFGKALFRFRDKHKTEYVIALIPLGGYVKMLDENEGKVAAKDLPYAFNRQPYYKKFLIVLAGPFINIVSAFFLYWLIFVIGFTAVKPIIGEVTPRSIAAEAGLRAHDEIESIDNTPTASWSSIIFRLLVHAGNKDHLAMGVRTPNDQTQIRLLDMSNWHLNDLTPDPLESLGLKPFEPTVPLIVGIIAAESPAQSSNLKIGDKIIAINNKPIKKWDEVTQTIMDQPGKTVTFTIMRKGKVSTFPVVIGTKHDLPWQTAGYLGIGPDFKWPANMLHKVQYGPFAALQRAGQEIIDFSYFNVLLFAKMVTGKISVQSLGGPITIFESAGNALNSGFLAFIAFLAFLSISIGIINLFPIPGLDGGHLIIYLIEMIIRKPVPDYVLTLMFRLGFILLLFVLLQAFINDILRLS